MNVKNTKDVSANKMAFCVYGPSGVGKTTLVGTLPGKVLMLSAEQGELSLKGKDVDYVHVTDWAGVKEFMEFVQTDEAKKKYDWIVLDSMSELGERCLEACELKFKGEDNKFKLWDTYKKELTKIIKFFRDTPSYHSLHIYQQDTREDDMGRRMTTFKVSGSLRASVPYFYDEVFYMCVNKNEKGKETRVVKTAPSIKVIAKDRSGALDEKEAPDMAEILNKILS